MVPIDEDTPILRNDSDDMDEVAKQKKATSKKHFEMIKMKSEMIKREKEEAYERKLERNKKNY